MKDQFVLSEPSLRIIHALLPYHTVEQMRLAVKLGMVGGNGFWEFSSGALWILNRDGSGEFIIQSNGDLRATVVNPDGQESWSDAHSLSELLRLFGPEVTA